MYSLFSQFLVLLDYHIVPSICSSYYIIILNTDGTQIEHKLYTDSPLEHKLNTN